MTGYTTQIATNTLAMKHISLAKVPSAANMQDATVSCKTKETHAHCPNSLPAAPMQQSCKRTIPIFSPSVHALGLANAALDPCYSIRVRKRHLKIFPILFARPWGRSAPVRATMRGPPRCRYHPAVPSWRPPRG